MSENSHEIPEKLSGISKIKGFQAKKYDATIRPFRCLAIPHQLLNLDLTGNEFKAMIKLWNWFQGPEIKGLTFSTSRAHLAKLASISEDTAKHTLQKLKRIGALNTVSTSFGVSIYEWNCGYFYGGVTEIQSGGDWKSSGPWMEISHPLTGNHPASIICTLIIPLYIPSYTAFSGHKKTVDNSTEKISASLGSIKVALRAGLPRETLKDALRAGLPIEKVVGLADALMNTWIAGNQNGSFWLTDILLILKTFKLNLYESENPTAVLYSLLKNGENLHNARKQFPHFYSDEESLLEHYFELHKQFQKENL